MSHPELPFIPEGAESTMENIADNADMRWTHLA
jgi:hypothetical protein